MFETQMVMDGVAARLRYERNERMSHAWHVEAFARTKKLPKLKDVMMTDKRPSKARMTPEQLEAVTRSWLSSRKRR